MAEKPSQVNPAPKPDQKSQTQIKKNKPIKKQKKSHLLWVLPLVILLGSVLWFVLKKERISPETQARFTALKAQADLFAEKLEWKHALEKYQEAYSLISDEVVQDSISSINHRFDLLESGMRAYNQVDYKEAMASFQVAANLNLAEAYTMLGFMHYWGHGLDAIDRTKAGELFEKAVSLGDDKANLGLASSEKNPVNKEDLYRRASKAIIQRAEEKEPFWKVRLAGLYQDGNGVQKDVQKGISLLKEAAQAGNPQAQLNLGFAFHYGNGVQKNYQETERLYRLAADQGHPAAEFNMGILYRDGLSVQQNFAEAYNWFERAAKKGFANAEFEIGLLYYNGTGVKKDDTEAVKWYLKAAEQEYTLAERSLGIMYANGYGVKKDDTEAVKWYRKAANKGNATAQLNLGIMYANGRGVKRDYTEAVKWYRKAADQGNASAQNNLGVMYARGTGVNKNENEAINWFKKAAAQGNVNAKNSLRSRGIN